MPGTDGPAEPAILHVANDQQAISQRMHEALVKTGRTVLQREDLYRAMGSVAACRRGRSLEAIVIATNVIGPEDGEFFQLLDAQRSRPPIYLYGECEPGSIEQNVRNVVTRQITPEGVPGLFPGAVGPTRQPDFVEEATQPAGSTAKDGPETSGQTTPEAERADASGLMPGGPAEVLEERVPQAVEDPEATKPTETDKSDTDQAPSEPLRNDAPPVPWRPSPHRPIRTPPRREVSEPPGQGDEGKPLLSQEELEALLNLQTETPDSTEPSA